MENRATAPRGRNDHSERIPECDRRRRKRVNGMLDPGTRTELGQFMTPAAVASVLAECIDVDRDELHLLDPGSGVGSLTAAVVARILSSEHRPKTVSLTTYEIDPTMREGLAETLSECEVALAGAGVSASSRIIAEDFVESALSNSGPGLFTAAILIHRL